mmetsp:Transcript_15237/g.50033  ORF Transcript_15237/g.50033 Transcript_15237/m.50033 type:complete len:298 (-) Transcript_15237:348-1241(-)
MRCTDGANGGDGVRDVLRLHVLHHRSRVEVALLANRARKADSVDHGRGTPPFRPRSRPISRLRPSPCRLRRRRGVLHSSRAVRAIAAVCASAAQRHLGAAGARDSHRRHLAAELGRGSHVRGAIVCAADGARRPSRGTLAPLADARLAEGVRAVLQAHGRQHDVEADCAHEALRNIDQPLCRLTLCNRSFLTHVRVLPLPCCPCALWARRTRGCGGRSRGSLLRHRSRSHLCTRHALSRHGWLYQELRYVTSAKSNYLRVTKALRSCRRPLMLSSGSRRIARNALALAYRSFVLGSM